MDLLRFNSIYVILLQIVALVFGIGLVVRFFMYSGDRMHEHVEQTHMEPQESFITHTDIDRSEQESVKSSEESIASEKTAETRSEPVCLPRKEAVEEENQEQSQDLSSRTKLEVRDRRRTVSEGHCSECHSSDDAKCSPVLVRLDSSPPRVEYKARTLEECKLMLKQPVCLSLFFSKPELQDYFLLLANCKPFKIDCFLIYVSKQDGVLDLTDKEIQMLVESKTIPGHQLEKVLKDPARAVRIRYKETFANTPMKQNYRMA